MALELNNLKRVDMPLNKETKPNKSKIRFILFDCQTLWLHGTVIIITKWFWKYRLPLLFSAIRPFRLSLQAGSQDCIRCLHRADVLGTMGKRLFRQHQNENNTDISFYQIYLPKLHENILEYFR